MKTDKLTFLLLVSLSLIGTYNVTNANDLQNSYQAYILTNPGKAQLQREANGSVFIYEGLTDTQVNMAMDQQWERIRSMMFVSTQITDDQGSPIRDSESGNIVTEDDGCD